MSSCILTLKVVNENGSPVEGACLNILSYVSAGVIDHTKEISYFSNSSGIFSLTVDQGAKIVFQSEDISQFDVSGLGPVFIVPEKSAYEIGSFVSKPDVRLSGVGAAYGSGITAFEQGNGALHKTVLTFVNAVVPLADNAGVVAYGSRKVYDFPAGAIRHLGTLQDLDLTKSSTGVNADWNGDIGVGTVAANSGNSLATTEQNVISTTATPQAVAGVTTGNGQSTSTEGAAIFDGTTTPIDLFLNILVDDADHDVTGTPCDILINGTMTILWSNLGDY